MGKVVKLRENGVDHLIDWLNEHSDKVESLTVIAIYDDGDSIFDARLYSERDKAHPYLTVGALDAMKNWIIDEEIDR